MGFLLDERSIFHQIYEVSKENIAANHYFCWYSDNHKFLHVTGKGWKAPKRPRNLFQSSASSQVSQCVNLSCTITFLYTVVTLYMVICHCSEINRANCRSSNTIYLHVRLVTRNPKLSGVQSFCSFIHNQTVNGASVCLLDGSSCRFMLGGSVLSASNRYELLLLVSLGIICSDGTPIVAKLVSQKS